MTLFQLADDPPASSMSEQEDTSGGSISLPHVDVWHKLAAIELCARRILRRHADKTETKGDNLPP